MSKDKAINGSVRVVIDRQEFWVKPEEIIVNNRTLDEIESEARVLKIAFDEFRETTLMTLERLIVSDKQNRKLLERQQKALADFMASVIKGGF